MSVVLEAFHELFHVLVHVCVERYVVHPLVELALRRELSVDQEISRLQKRAVFGQLLDRVAPVLQDSPLTVNVSYRAAAGSRIGEPGVVDHETEVPLVRLHLTKVLGPYGAVCDGQFVHLPSAVVSDCQGLALAIISGRPRLFVCLHAHLLILRQRATGCFG